MNLKTQTNTPKLRGCSSSSLDWAVPAEPFYSPLHNNPLHTHTHTHTLLQLASSQRATQYKLTRSNYGGRGGRNWEKESECVCVRKTVRFIERAKRNMKEKERVRSFPPSIHYEPNWLELAVGCSWFHHDNHCGNGQEIKTLTRATSTSTVHTGPSRKSCSCYPGC